MPLISIIAPIFNTDKYLCKCLDSIIDQTFTDYELILVDDGSSDNSGKICDEYAAKDTRIKVVHKNNEGVSIARNAGIDISTGEWIAFLDSDDSYAPDAMESMLKCVLQTSSDVCLCPVKWDNSACDNSVRVLNNNEKEKLIWACLAYRTSQYLKCGYMVDATHAKLYRASIIRDNRLRFVGGLCKSEDSIFDAYFYNYANSIVMFAHPVYEYTMNPDSIGHSFKWSYLDMFVRVLKEENLFVNKFFPGNDEFKNSVRVRSFVALYQMIDPASGLSLPLYIKTLKKYLNADIVRESLNSLTKGMVKRYFPGRTTVLDWQLSRRRWLFLLYFKELIRRNISKLITLKSRLK